MRLVRQFAVFAVVATAAPVLACGPNTGLGIQLGSVFFGFSKHRQPCGPVVVAQALPPTGYYTQTQGPVYVTPPPPPPVVYAPQPPVVYANPPLVYGPPPVVVRAPPAPRPESDRPSFLAIKYMPGISSTFSTSSGDMSLGKPSFAHSPGIELRLTRWLSLRSDLEFRKEARTWDMLGVKLSLLPRSPLKPYASVSFSGNENLSNPGKYSFGFAGAAGLDLMLGKHFFLEAEARYRVTPGDCCSNVPSLTGVVGGGVAFF